MAEYETLLGMGLGPEADMPALAKRLRGRGNLGRFLSLSTVPGVAELGASEIKGARQAARRGGVLRRSLAKEAESKRRYEAGVKTTEDKTKYERDQDRINRELAEEDLKYQRGRNTESDRRADELHNLNTQLKRDEINSQGAIKTFMKPDGTLAQVTTNKRGQPMDIRGNLITDMAGWKPYKAGGFGLKPTGAAVKQLAQSRSLMGQMNDANELFNSFTAEQQAGSAKKWYDVGTSMLPAALETAFQEDIYPDNAVRDYREMVAKVEGDFSKLMSGMAVTGFEMKDRQRWSPFAPGLEEDQRAARINKLQNIVSREQRIFNELYPDYAQTLSTVKPSEQPKAPGGPTGAPGASSTGEGGTGLESPMQISIPHGAEGPAPAPPKIGEVRDGYTFMGGDPADESNWEK